jgi:membrane protease YdiL (CAAX protease family)
VDPTPPRRPTLWQAWSPLRLALLALLLLVGYMFWQAAIYGLTGDVFLPVVVGAAAAVVVPCAALARWHGQTLATTFDLHGGRHALGVGCLAGLFALAPASWLAGWSARLRPPSADYLAFLSEQLPDGLLGTLVALVAVSLAAPVAEELVFRGLIFRAARERWGPGRAALLSGLFFGIAHWQPWSLFGLVALGILLAGLYHWTRSLLAPIAAHAAHNAVSLLLLLRTREHLTTESPGAGAFAGPGALILALASTVLLLSLLRWVRRQGR